jgi:hypothetical protein
MSKYLLKGNCDLGSEMISFSFEVRVLDFYKLKNDITRSSLHSLVSHIGIS